MKRSRYLPGRNRGARRTHDAPGARVTQDNKDAKQPKWLPLDTGDGVREAEPVDPEDMRVISRLLASAGTTTARVIRSHGIGEKGTACPMDAAMLTFIPPVLASLLTLLYGFTLDPDVTEIQVDGGTANWDKQARGDAFMKLARIVDEMDELAQGLKPKWIG